MPTTTPHGLRYPSLSDAANGPVGIQNLAQDVALTLPVVCTSATRPAHAAARYIYETDTAMTYVSNGTVWSRVAGVLYTEWTSSLSVANSTLANAMGTPSSSVSVGPHGLTAITNGVRFPAVAATEAPRLWNIDYQGNYSAVITGTNYWLLRRDGATFAKDTIPEASTDFGFVSARLYQAANTGTTDLTILAYQVSGASRTLTSLLKIARLV